MSTYPITIERPEVAPAIEIRPQPRQEQFLASAADITIYGGAAGGGKTYALLMEPLRHWRNPKFGAVIFRRTVPEIIKEGGIWDESMRLYPLLGAKPNENNHQHRFPGGARVTFGSLQYERDLRDWRSAQIALIGFDQLETFTRAQFFYMLSRNRSMSGVAGYVRGTCNPEPGWLADFLEWWIAEDGYADLARVGRVRWLLNINDTLHWADTPDELMQQFPGARPKSVTFILSTVYDNKILLEKDPGYLANLQALSFVDRARLLGDPVRGGNWKIKPSAGTLFNSSWFEVVEAVPAGGQFLRFWDLAATEKKTEKDDPDFTASVKACMVAGITYVVDVSNELLEPARADAALLNTAKRDGTACVVRWEREGGASGKRDSYHITTMLQGFDARGVAPLGDKVTRAKPAAAQALAGNVKLLRASWNEAFLAHLHGQPDLPHDDMMDAFDGAYSELVRLPRQKARSMPR